MCLRICVLGGGSEGDGVGCTGEKEDMAHLCVCAGLFIA